MGTILVSIDFEKRLISRYVGGKLDARWQWEDPASLTVQLLWAVWLNPKLVA